MSEPLLAPMKASAGASLLALVTAGGTLVCCVLPAVMVALGAGAALAGLVSAVPQLAWLSTHKGFVFGVAGAALALSGALLWRARRAPCPADPALARACARLRRLSQWTWGLAAASTAAGALFAFALPMLMA
ncbi:MAG: hypothetical protein ACK59M_09735 [Pseudomonadota bacterium]|jgi:hypothetical protein